MKIREINKDSRGRMRDKRLCSRLKNNRCISKKSFKRGDVLLNIFVVDESGNYEVGVIRLEIEY